MSICSAPLGLRYMCVNYEVLGITLEFSWDSDEASPFTSRSARNTSRRSLSPIASASPIFVRDHAARVSTNV